MRWKWGLVSTACAIILISTNAASAKKLVFEAPGRNYGVWQLTFDPTARDWANYHNTQSFSFDGRYVCYTHWAAGRPNDTTVHVFDLSMDEDREIGPGFNPRWARHHNWLLYAWYNPQKRTRRNLGTESILFEIRSWRRKVIAEGPGAEWLGETTFDDRWLIAAQRFRGQTPEFRLVRIALPGGGMEPLPEASGAQLLPNPRHPLFFTRQDHQADPFAATRYWFDLDGTNRRIAVPTLQQCHMSWLGNGEFMLLGNGLVRGRRWNEPFPSNVEVLASVGVGDISPCGTSGRWVCGDSTLADLRSGDGWHTVDPLSQICYPSSIADNSGIYDADPKGSPDGTKISFVSNYPLSDGPRTAIVSHDRRNDRLIVESTAGFPQRGHLCLQREVIGYESTTPTSFDGITRQMFDTVAANPRAGRIVTSFESRCLSRQQFQQMGRPNYQLQKSVGAADSPLMRQRMTDLYVVVVRKPDRPYLRTAATPIALIPGENHAETRGYHLMLGERRITDTPILPGSELRVEKPGDYRAVAVEWSGLESDPSDPVTVSKTPTSLVALSDAPADFSWTTERWTDGSRTVREMVHLYDGVIRREWFSNDVIQRRHDVNQDGMAVRRTNYVDGTLSRREFHHPTAGLVSRELFDTEGFITESFGFRQVEGKRIERDHWFFERGMPMRHIVAGRREYVKQGDRWGYSRDGQFIDTPRER